MIKKILVIGATGMLGKPVANHLLSQGFGIRILSRNPQKANALFPAPFEVVTGNVEDSVSLTKAILGCQAVHINLHGLFDPDLERRGGETIARVAQDAGLERISYLSGASVSQENAWFPDTKARLLAEQAIKSSGVPYTIFRSNFFMETLRNFVRGKFLLQIGKHPHPYQWIAAADYAALVAKAYTIPASANKTFFVCGPQALSMHAALEIMQRLAYPTYRIVYLPLAMARIIAWLGRRRELQSTLPFFAYCEKIESIMSGSTTETDALLGAPPTTLEEWIQKELKQQPLSSKIR